MNVASILSNLSAKSTPTGWVSTDWPHWSTCFNQSKQVKLEVSATTLPLPITFESRRKKMVSVPCTTEKNLSITQTWLKASFCTCSCFCVHCYWPYQWGCINLLIWLAWFGIEYLYPVYLTLPKKGKQWFWGTNCSYQQSVTATQRDSRNWGPEFCSVWLVTEAKVYL